MTLKRISLIWFALTAVSAYRHIYTSPVYARSSEIYDWSSKPSEGRNSEFYDRSSRPSERRSSEFYERSNRPSQRRSSESYERSSRPSERSSSEFYERTSRPSQRRSSEFHEISSRPNGRRSSEFHERSSRPSERSITFSSSQRVQAQEWSRLNSPEPRHGNLTVKTAAYTKTYPSVASRRGSPVDPDSVVFPGPTNRRGGGMFEPDVPLECQTTGICEAVPNYPHEYVNDLLSKIDDVQNRFNLDVETPEIAQRQGPGEETLELCEHRETIIYPRAAKNVQGSWVFIVNKENEPVQGFKGELCVNVDQSCSEIALFTDKYKATCQQKRVEKAMWSLNKDGQMVKQSIPMPSCCTCIVKVVS